MTRYLQYLCVSVVRFCLFPLYFLSGFVPRDKKLWVFGSWGGYRYADNGAAFFEYCNRALNDEATLVWISRKPSIVKQVRASGYRAHLTWSPAGVWYALRAELFHQPLGVGKDGKYWSKALREQGLRLEFWVDVNPRKIGREIHGAPVLSYEEFANLTNPPPHLLITVGINGARESIRNFLDSNNYVEEKDFTCVA